MSQRVRILVPLSLALVLTGAFVVLLIRQASELNGLETAEPTPAVAATTPQTGVQISNGDAPTPRGSPSDKRPYKKRPQKRFAGKFSRWNLKELPEGWDDAVAGSLHGYFESMERLEKGIERRVRVTPEDPLERARNDVREYLASLGADALPTLAQILEAEQDFVFRRFLLYAIGDLGGETADSTWVLRDYFMTRYEDPENRSESIHVVKAMGNLQNDASFEMLSELVGRKDRSSLRSYQPAIIEALGEHERRDEASDLFVRKMLKGKSINIRNKSAQALGKVQSPDTLGDLYEAFDREHHWAAKQTILGTIGKIGNPNSIPFLQEQARSAKQDSVRISAASALRRIGTPYAYQLLRTLARTESNPKVRKYISGWVEEQK